MTSFLQTAFLRYSSPILLTGSLIGCAQSEEASVLDIFPPSGLVSTADKTTCSFTYEPSGSTWVEGIDEEQVFLASFAGEGWRLGVGKGGHIYSLRGEYGESVPPQRTVSPWNDEVWQAVITSEVLATPIHAYHADHPEAWGDLSPLLYFVHQAGIYVKGAGNDGGGPAPFYSPCLGKRWDPETKTLQLVNWMQQANSPCIWRSGVLIYTAFRDLGEGVIEVNQVLHNFGSVPLDYVSAPWGGVRKSSLPNTVISKADGSWAVETGLWNWDGVPERRLPESGGWAAWTKDAEDDASPALSMVFGTKMVEGTEDRPANFVDVFGRIEGERQILWGTAGEGTARDYEAAEQVAKIAVHEGDSYSIRWYLVSGEFAKVREVSATLTDKAGIKTIDFDSTSVQSIWVDSGEVSLSEKGERWGGFLAFPVKDSVPVFLLKDKKTGESLITADIYALAPKKPFPNPLPEDHEEYERYQDRFYHEQYLPHIGYENLLGYAYKEETEDTRIRKITAPEGVRLHESAQDLWIIK